MKKEGLCLLFAYQQIKPYAFQSYKHGLPFQACNVPPFSLGYLYLMHIIVKGGADIFYFGFSCK